PGDQASRASASASIHRDTRTSRWRVTSCSSARARGWFSTGDHHPGQRTPAMADERSGPSSLLDMIVGKWLSQAICVAAELGIADLLKDGPLTSAEIATRIGASEDGVHRLLRALAGVGLFSESAGRRFALTSLGDALRGDVPASLRGFARFVGHEVNGSPW